MGVNTKAMTLSIFVKSMEFHDNLLFQIHPQQNGVAEINNRILIGATISMLS
jgi:hypothetical protein